MLRLERQHARERPVTREPFPEFLMISYAQNFEDVILRRVFRDQTDGFYIDVGAMDPTLESVTKFFYDEGWSGINIEPNDWFFDKLLTERPRDINLNVALGEREESREFFVFERIGNSTFEEASRDRYIERGFEATSKRVAITTLSAVCQDYASRPIDFLKVDCEGWESLVLKGADWDSFRPIVVVVEATEPGTTIPSWSDWEPYLIENARYEMVYFDGLNRFYLRRESLHLRNCFALPPNVFDDFKVYATIAAEAAVPPLQAHRDWLAEQVAALEGQLAHQAAEREKGKQELAVTSQTLQKAEAEVARLSSELSSAEMRAVHLEQKLLKSKLWVGQLSQELAASRSR